MSDVLIEVREAIKQERMERFWKNYGSLIIGFIILLIISTAVYEGIKAWKIDQSKKQSVVFLDALESKDNQVLLDKTAALQDGLKTLAQLRAAGGFEENGDTESAIAVYKDLMSNKNTPPEFQRLADYALLRLDNTLPAEQKILKLSQIWADESNPWRFHARLDAAVILANDLKNYTEARAQLLSLQDAPIVPKTLKQKATSLDILYSVLQTAQEQNTDATSPATPE